MKATNEHKNNRLTLEKNPRLEAFIEQGEFLIGYTKGGKKGDRIAIFLCHSPWTNNCIQATACECITAGKVLVVSDDLPWSILGRWHAYSLNRATIEPGIEG